MCRVRRLGCAEYVRRQDEIEAASEALGETRIFASSVDGIRASDQSRFRELSGMIDRAEVERVRAARAAQQRSV